MQSISLLLCWYAFTTVTGLLRQGIKPWQSQFTKTALHSGNEEWKKISDIVTINSPWVNILGERLKDHEGKTLDYWRVEKAHSAVVLTLHRDQLIFPKPMYRPGLGHATLDFPGGRVPEGSKPIDVVSAILFRELGIEMGDIDCIEPLNENNGWPINSSFSNQLLYGFVATLRDEVELDIEMQHNRSYTLDEVDTLLEQLPCLQCRSVLLEYLRKQRP